jgi:hypothetical protein
MRWKMCETPIETQIEFHHATMQLNHTTKERLWDPCAYETSHRMLHCNINKVSLNGSFPSDVWTLVEPFEIRVGTRIELHHVG